MVGWGGAEFGGAPMLHRLFLHRLFLLFLAAALVAGGCAPGDDAASEETASAASAATTTTTAPAPTADVQPGSPSALFPAGQPLDFVLLADSGGGGVAERYAAKAAEALDREIRVHDHSTGGATANDILSNVRGRWADDVADAEIVVFYVHPGGFDPPSFVPCLEAVNWDSPVPPSTFPPTLDPPEATTVEDWQGYRDTIDQIYDEIWKLRAGQPTIIRAYGVYLPWLGQWRHLGIEPPCVAGEEAVDQVRRESAQAHGAIFVSIMDVFAGPEHDQDPVEKGWISEDGMHVSEAGAAALVDALAAAGFEPSEAPN